MLLMVEKGIRGGMCHAIHRYAQANNKYMKNYDQNKEPSYLKYWDVNNLYGWEMSQNCQVNKFEKIEDTSKFNEHSTNYYNQENYEGFFLEVDVQYLEILHELHNYLQFLSESENRKSRKVCY